MSTQIENKINKEGGCGFSVFECSECGTVALIPSWSKLPLIMDCVCGKPLAVQDNIILAKVKEKTTKDG